MAKEKWTVFFDIQEQTTIPPANWKEKDIIVNVAGSKAEKNSGIDNTDQTSIINTAGETELLNRYNSSRTFGEKLFINEPLQCYFVTIEAEGAEEAALAVRRFYGPGFSGGLGKVLATKSGATETIKEIATY